MFKSTDQLTSIDAPAASLALAYAMTTPLRACPVAPLARLDRLRAWANGITISTDLAYDVGSADWLRGLAVFIGLSATAIAMVPEFRAMPVAGPVTLSAAEFDEARAQMLMPLALGGDTGRRMAATDAVVALKASPERPQIALTATLGPGDSFARLLNRAGVSRDEARMVTALVASQTSLSGITPGTRIDIVLGRRADRTAARPLESVDFRARLDLALAIDRDGSGLNLTRKAIAVDSTPLRIRGTVGSSLYRSARAAGAPVEAVQAFLRVINTRMPVSTIRASDEFDLVIDYRRAETGEVEVGKLRYAGIDRDGAAKAQMLRWQVDGRSQFFEASGIGESRGVLSRPVDGAITSGFGSRRHPILGFRRMHNGLDFKAGYGSPIRAASDGVVTFAGRKGGYGNFIRLSHAGGIGTGYGHLSRFAVSPGRRVQRGELIGYVGSTGLSTGPHLHYELYRDGHPVNPMSVKFTQRAQLTGADLARFEAELARLKAVRPGAALTGFTRTATREPQREIEGLTQPLSGTPL